MVTDANMVKEEQNVPKLGGGGGSPTKTSSFMIIGSLRPVMIWMRPASLSLPASNSSLSCQSQESLTAPIRQAFPTPQ